MVPFSADYLAGGLFGSGTPLDRDGVLAPYVQLRETMRAEGFELRTVDELTEPAAAWLHLDSRASRAPDVDPRRTVVVVLEPEVVAPHWYDTIKAGRLDVAEIHLLSAELADEDKIRLIRYPQNITIAADSETPRDLDVVMINSRKRAVRTTGELYSKRERMAAGLARRGDIAVFGNGWGKATPRHPVSWWRNLAIGRSDGGTIGAKADVLRRARFCLCFENSRHPGYLTEKLFDAMAAGAIPIYLGDPTVRSTVNAGWVDFTELGSAAAVSAFVRDITAEDEAALRQQGYDWLASPKFAPFTIDAFCDSIVGSFRRVLAAAEPA
ncbi:MAG: hypothetical protein ACI867_001309 [Glaciecola sp.]